MNSNYKVKVILADDHAVLREGIARYLEKHSDSIKIVGEASNWKELMTLLKTEIACDVAVLDMTMPGGEGLNEVKNIKIRFPHINILMLSAFPEEEYAMRFIRVGASGFISKVGSLKALIPCIRDAAEGKHVISENLKEKLALEKLKIGSPSPSHENLTDREFQVLVQIGSGKSPSEVAGLLHLSPKTVSTHRNSIMRKMDWKHNGEMIFYVIHKGLVNKI